MGEFPETTHLQISQAWDWLRLLLFVAVAWWLGGDLRRSGQVLLLALLGLFVGMTFYLFSHGQSLTSGQRTGFHLKIIAFGLYSSTAVLGLLVLAPRMWGTKHSLPSFALRVGLWLITLAVLVQGLFMTQSRGAWLTAAIVIPPVTMVRYWKLGSQEQGSWRLSVAVACAALLVCGALVGVNLPTISHRLSQEKEMFAAAWRGDFEAVPSAGFGVRVHTFRFGVTKWLERPLFGWGPGSTVYLISHSDLPQLRHSKLVNGKWEAGHEWLDHLHNTYLEILVRFGLVGAFLIVSVLGLLARGLWVSSREGRLPLDYTWFLAGAMGLMAIWSLSDFRLLHPDWRSYWALMGGIVGTFRMPRGLPESSLEKTAAAHQREAEDVRGAL
jgi:O-antigen ligase